MNKEQWQEVFNSVMDYIREYHDKDIEDAYEFFWEEESPEEFLSGTPLIMGFHNFEDWAICDYNPKGAQPPYIDSYIETKSPDEDTLKALRAMQDSYISLFEVKSAGDETTLHCLTTNKDISIKDERLKTLSKGDMFGARILELGEGLFMTSAIYPFGSNFKESVMKHYNAMYDRYAKHCDGEPSHAAFLKQESYTINTVWVTCLFRAK